MPSSNPHLLDQESVAVLDRLVITCCGALFDSYGIATHNRPDLSPTPLLPYAAILGFSGAELRGSLFVSIDARLLAASSPMATDTPLDWCGEIANQLVGRIKNQLTRFDVGIEVGTPVAVTGERMVSTICSLHTSRGYAFESPYGAYGVYVDVRLLVPLLLRESEAADAGVQQEGEIVLF
jgi:hypothetical protein